LNTVRGSKATVTCLHACSERTRWFPWTWLTSNDWRGNQQLPGGSDPRPCACERY